MSKPRRLPPPAIGRPDLPGVSRPSPFDGRALPPGGNHLTLLGVHYIRLATRDGGDLYMTRFGLPYLEQLKLKNWREEEWFTAHREKLQGTSTVYRVPSKEVDGRSVDLVVKWCRVGEEVPLDTMTFDRFSDAEFNSPFEEFSLLMEMRERASGPRIRTNRPLAIYVPPEQLELWQTGRSKSKMARKRTRYQDVELDILRQYILIYEWVKGRSADEALDDLIPDPAERRKELARLTGRTRLHMEQNGFMVADHKPAHIVLRPLPDGRMLAGQDGDSAYALIDFELLVRTPEYEKEVEAERRTAYLHQQRERFSQPGGRTLPEHLRRVKVLDVDYIWGRAESTHGMLWVVGQHPDLFDYFLPERWRHTSRTRLSSTAETYHTISKDHIKLVWKVSRVGESPTLDPSTSNVEHLMAHGYNSPFEEFSIAMTLFQKGFSVVYPRAIYRAGLESPRAQEYVTDPSRFESHEALRTPEGGPILRREHNYITVWGFWQGRIGGPGAERLPVCSGVNLRQACEEGLLSEAEVQALLVRKTARLQAAGFEANLKPTHFLLSRTAEGEVLRAEDGTPSVTICNFELLKPLQA